MEVRATFSWCNPEFSISYNFFVGQSPRMEFLDRVSLLPGKPLCKIETTLAGRALRKTCTPKSRFVHRVVHHKRSRCNKNSFLIGEQWAESYRYAVYQKLYFFSASFSSNKLEFMCGKVKSDNRNKYCIILYKNFTLHNNGCCVA